MHEVDLAWRTYSGCQDSTKSVNSASTPVLISDIESKEMMEDFRANSVLSFTLTKYFRVLSSVTLPPSLYEWLKWEIAKP